MHALLLYIDIYMCGVSGNIQVNNACPNLNRYFSSLCASISWENQKESKWRVRIVLTSCFPKWKLSGLCRIPHLNFPNMKTILQQRWFISRLILRYWWIDFLNACGDIEYRIIILNTFCKVIRSNKNSIQFHFKGRQSFIKT